jgi:predicted component of type VI protein secretion system
VGVLDKIERGVESAVNNAFSLGGRGDIKPVELATRLRREMDDRAAVVGQARTVAPNEYILEMASADLDQIEAWGADTLAQELAGNLTEYAATQHYAFAGPVSVQFHENVSQAPGRFAVTSASVRGAVAPATAATQDRHPLLDIDGQRYLLTGAVTVIGRDASADIVVDDPGVSRRHLEIRATPDGVVATDLGSTNGLYVEGHRVPAATLLDGNTLTIGRTRIMFWSGNAPTTEDW